MYAQLQSKPNATATPEALIKSQRSVAEVKELLISGR
jgi:hypothetical protein